MLGAGGDGRLRLLDVGSATRTRQLRLRPARSFVAATAQLHDGPLPAEAGAGKVRPSEAPCMHWQLRCAMVAGCRKVSEALIGPTCHWPAAASWLFLKFSPSLNAVHRFLAPVCRAKRCTHPWRLRPRCWRP